MAEYNWNTQLQGLEFPRETLLVRKEYFKCYFTGQIGPKHQVFSRQEILNFSSVFGSRET